jgi:hypothetical protein
LDSIEAPFYYLWVVSDRIPDRTSPKPSLTPPGLSGCGRFSRDSRRSEPLSRSYPRMGSQFAGRGNLRASLSSQGLLGRQDVYCRIEIGVGRVPAGDAEESRLVLAVLRCAVATLRAGL